MPRISSLKPSSYLTSLIMNNSTAMNKVINLQLLDVPTILKGLTSQSANEMKNYYKAEILDNIADLDATRDKIFVDKVRNVRGGMKHPNRDKVQTVNIGYIRTFIGKLDAEQLEVLGLTSKEQDVLKNTMNDYCNATKTTKKDDPRHNGVFSEKQKEVMQDSIVEDVQRIIDEIKAAYEAAAEYCKKGEVWKYRNKIERPLRMLLYATEPNVRSAWHNITPDGNSLDDNINMFSKCGRVVVTFNRLKRQSQAPIVVVISDYTAKALKRYYETFYVNIKYHGNLFRNADDRNWNRNSWTNRVTDDLKDLFDGKLGAKMMRVLNCMTAIHESERELTENEKIAIATARGQTYVPNQANLSNRVAKKGKKRALESDVDGSSSKKQRSCRTCSTGHPETDDVDNCDECLGF
ncbi:hypothetical protein HDV00_011397 [Rhizophlyctis rosea]|nr:hypothetical protein HDV00_011397 [Rhizophlyctis rosea]